MVQVLGTYTKLPEPESDSQALGRNASNHLIVDVKIKLNVTQGYALLPDSEDLLIVTLNNIAKPGDTVIALFVVDHLGHDSYFSKSAPKYSPCELSKYISFLEGQLTLVLAACCSALVQEKHIKLEPKVVWNEKPHEAILRETLQSAATILVLAVSRWPCSTLSVRATADWYADRLPPNCQIVCVKHGKSRLIRRHGLLDDLSTYLDEKQTLSAKCSAHISPPFPKAAIDRATTLPDCQYFSPKEAFSHGQDYWRHGAPLPLSPVAKSMPHLKRSTLITRLHEPPLATSRDEDGEDGFGKMPVRSLHQINRPIFDHTFTYEELRAATSNFSLQNLLGSGAVGKVYKGCLPNGELVAVKRLEAKKGPVNAFEQWKQLATEIDVIRRIFHRNLVSLEGGCIAGSELLLVFPLVKQGSLDNILRDSAQAPLEWGHRLNIAIGAAEGLKYLHEYCSPPIIHRDVKAANILIDDNFEALVADFGLAKFVEGDQAVDCTQLMGTFGYMAPEYGCSLTVTEKCDVFAFGVVIFELITGRSPVFPGQLESLATWASKLTLHQRLDELPDPRLGGVFHTEQLWALARCAVLCCAANPNDRPTMSEVVRWLEDVKAL